MKVAGRSALVQIAPSSQQITAHAGLVLVRELADRLGLPELLDEVTVKKRRRGFTPGQAILALCETLIAGGDCLDDAALLRADSAQELLRGHRVPDPTTLGRFLARFNLGHVSQLNRSLDHLFARVHPLLEREQATLDLDSTLVEHHGPAGSRQGTRGTYAGKVAWHPLVCFVAETGEWLHAKLRNGHAAPSTGARRFLAECLRRLPEDSRLYLRADEGFFGQDFLAELERMQITYSIGAPLIASVRQRIREIPASDWRPSSYRKGARWQASAGSPRRGRSRAASSSAATRCTRASSSRSRGRSGITGRSSQTTRGARRTRSSLGTGRRPNIENRIKEAKLGLGLDNLPCHGFHANWAYLLCTLLAYNLLCWLKHLALPEGERTSYAKRLRFRFIAVAGTVGRSGRRLVLRLSVSYALLGDFARALERIRGLARAPA